MSTEKLVGGAIKHHTQQRSAIVLLAKNTAPHVCLGGLSVQIVGVYYSRINDVAAVTATSRMQTTLLWRTGWRRNGAPVLASEKWKDSWTTHALRLAMMRVIIFPTGMPWPSRPKSGGMRKNIRDTTFYLARSEYPAMRVLWSSQVGIPPAPRRYPGKENEMYKHTAFDCARDMRPWAIIRAYERMRVILGHELLAQGLPDVPSGDQHDSWREALAIYSESLHQRHQAWLDADGPYTPEPVTPAVDLICDEIRHTTCTGNTLIIARNYAIQIIGRCGGPDNYDSAIRWLALTVTAWDCIYEPELIVEQLQPYLPDAGDTPGECYHADRVRLTACAQLLIALDNAPGDTIPTQYDAIYDESYHALYDSEWDALQMWRDAPGENDHE